MESSFLLIDKKGKFVIEEYDLNMRSLCFKRYNQSSDIIPYLISKSKFFKDIIRFKKIAEDNMCEELYIAKIKPQMIYKIINIDEKVGV